MVIDTYITRPAQTTHSIIRDVTYSQQEPWPVLEPRLPEFRSGQMPETGSRVTADSDRTDGSFSDRFQTFASDQIRENGTGPRVRMHKLSLVSITLIQITNQGSKQRFATQQTWAECKFAFRSEKQHPPPEPWPGFRSASWTIITCIATSSRIHNGNSLGIAYFVSTRLERNRRSRRINRSLPGSGHRECAKCQAS